ncbi:OadG family protein [Candidatus Allofournierella excrementavium]|uniref:OadG family protein n=1 Tax=Candidatus Allofournierella excrementavium TaxID=2838591 RepID=UPI003AEFE653
MNAVLLAAGAAQAAEPSVLVVAGIGMSLVFLVLILLTYIIALQGKLFDALNARKQKAAAEAAVKSQPQPPQLQEPMEAPPFVEEGISEEIVAVIAAAVAAASGGKYTLRAVKRAGGGQGSWGAAGVKSSTEPF